MTYQELCREGERLLSSAGIEEAENDARMLLFSVMETDRAGYALHLRDGVPKEKEDLYKGLLMRRSQREPLQYILGSADFYGRSFLVTQDVLIPRFDTETLIECALAFAEPGMRVLDLCTGSGCILVTLLLEREGLKGIGTDLSGAALDVAKENAARYHAEAEFLEGDLFGALKCREGEGKDLFDLIVSNPPYIKKAEIETLSREVRLHEPYDALDGGPDGLSFYRRIAEDAGAYLREGGALMCEIGYDEADDVCRLLKENGFTRIRTVKDLCGQDRVVEARKGGEIHGR